MKPIDFVVFDGDSSPNTLATDIAKAMTQEIEILSGHNKKWEVLSYYYDKVSKRMVLDIGKI